MEGCGGRRGKDIGGEVGEDDVMVGVDQGVGEGAEEVDEGLREKRAMEEEVKLAVLGARALEMVVGVVVEVEGREGVLGEEVGEEGNPVKVVRVGVEVPSKEDGAGGVIFLDEENAGREGSKGEGEVLVMARGWKIDANVGRGGEARNGEEEGKMGGGRGGENGDVGVQRGMPQGHGPTMGSAGREGKKRDVRVLAVEVVGVVGVEEG